MHDVVKFPKVSTWHLSGWKLRNHLLDHCPRESMTDCRSRASSFDVICFNILVSSAKRKILDFTDSGKSFMFTTKSRGPRTLPCGTYVAHKMLFVWQMTFPFWNLLESWITLGLKVKGLVSDHSPCAIKRDIKNISLDFILQYVQLHSWITHDNSRKMTTTDNFLEYKPSWNCSRI